MRIHLDFETYSETPIEEGLKRYMGDSFEVTLTALCFGDGPVLQWEGIPTLFLRSLAACEDIRWHAFNAPFEKAVLERYGIEVPLGRWRCTMAHAYCRGFSGSMATVGEAVGLNEDQAKFKDGKKLIHRFAKPAPKNHKIRRYTAQNDPQGWSRFRGYNVRDVVTERAIWAYLGQWPMTEKEQTLWELDRRINALGIPVDNTMCVAAIDHAAKYAEVYQEESERLTGGITGRQVGALLGWAKARGYTGDNLQAETIRRFLGETE